MEVRILPSEPNKMGRRQVVRHKVLVLVFGGSNPPAPDVVVINKEVVKGGSYV